jgi:tripartite-type tricarboxylate transporter receptor subunit TctC
MLAAASAWAQATIRLVVPVAAGGTLDAMARMLATQASQLLGEPVIVDNRPGAGGLIGTDAVVRSKPDGRTLLVSTSFVATNVVTTRGAPDPRAELKPVILLSGAEVFLVIHPALDIVSPSDLRTGAMRRPAGLNCGGATGQLTFSCERLRELLGETLVTTIPYPGAAQAMNALVAGQVDLVFAPRGVMAGLAEAGRVRPVALASAGKAIPPFDRLPPLTSTWPDWTTPSHTGLFVAADTPQPTIDRLNQLFNALLKKPEVRQAMLTYGYQPVLGGEPGELSAALKTEIDYYARIAARLGMKPQ